MLNRAINAIGRRISPSWAWNRQYASGLTYPKSQLMSQYVERHANGGNVVELGCGDGALAESVKPESFSHWSGWDISSEAIAKAEKRGIPNTSWIVGNIADWPDDGRLPTGFVAHLPPESVDLFVIEESLYYLSDDQQRQLLTRCKKSLVRDGTIIITIHDAKKHRNTFDNCLAASPDAKVENPSGGQRTYIFIKRG